MSAQVPGAVLEEASVPRRSASTTGSAQGGGQGGSAVPAEEME